MPIDMEDVARQAAELARRSTFRNIKRYRWRDNQNVLRLMGAGRFLVVKVFNHYGLPPNNERCSCYKNSFPELNLQCAIDDALWEIREHFKREKGEEMARKIVDPMSPSGRGMTNGVDRFNEAMGVQLVGITFGVVNWLVLEMAKNRIDVTDYERGCDTIINRVGTGFQVRYFPSLYQSVIEEPTGKVLRPVLTPLHSDANKSREWVESAYNVVELFPAPTNSDLAKVQAYANVLRDKYLATGTTMSMPSGPIAPAATSQAHAQAPAPAPAPAAPAPVQAPSVSQPVAPPAPAPPQTTAAPTAVAWESLDPKKDFDPSIEKIPTRPDGKYYCFSKGYDANLLKCIVCKDDTACQAAIGGK